MSTALCEHHAEPRRGLQLIRRAAVDSSRCGGGEWASFRWVRGASVKML